VSRNWNFYWQITWSCKFVRYWTFTRGPPRSDQRLGVEGRSLCIVSQRNTPSNERFLYLWKHFTHSDNAKITQTDGLCVQFYNQNLFQRDGYVEFVQADCWPNVSLTGRLVISRSRRKASKLNITENNRNFRDFGLPPPSKWDLPSSGILRRVDW